MDRSLNIPLRGQLRTRLCHTEFPVMPIARPPNDWGNVQKTKGVANAPLDLERDDDQRGDAPEQQRAVDE
jgi:hypothetical protein